jgi:type IV pilus assembly protein PilP
MVGVLQMGSHKYGLLQVPDGRVHRVEVGNYVGQADGHITAVTDDRISLTEVVPDGLGGYIERQEAIGLRE